MLSNPRIGERVRVHYAEKKKPGALAAKADVMPLHGKTGIVRIRARGRPRNHGVEIDGDVYVIPAGQLRRER